MGIVTSFNNNGIHAVSFCSNDISDFTFNNYDVVIVASSWDPRCLNITNSNISGIHHGILFTFDDKDDAGFRNKHDDLLKSWMSKNIINSKTICGKSTDVESSFSLLFSMLTTISLSHEKPINILFDLSTCPRFISLSTLSKGFNLGIIKRIDYFYGECLYPEPHDGILGGVEEVVFTSGDWNTLSLEHCLGQFDPSSKVLITVSIGFEGNKILRVLNIEDPDSVNILMPDPGFSEGYVRRVLEANSELISEYQVDDSRILKANAGDAVASWRILDLSIQNTPENSANHSYLCTGSKPHSLGMTLSAMANENVAVLYTLPKEHNFVEVRTVSKYWVYQVNNLTIPTISQAIPQLHNPD
jgi:hypothetical protein